MNPAPGTEESLQGQAIEWLMRMEEAPDDQAARAEFERWLSRSDSHRRAYAAVELVWGSSSQLAPLPRERREAVRAASPWRRLRHRGAVLAVTGAAACLAFFAVPALQLHLSADHITGTAELRDYILADGSRIALDAASAVAVDYAASRRSVRLLAGQAYFEVTPSKERPFVVAAGPVEVMVTGTAFNVATTHAGVDVAVRSGTVRVTRKGGERLAALTAGQRLKVADGGGSSEGVIDAQDIGAWRDRRFVVYDTSIRDIVEQVGRYMPGIIVFGDSRIADSRASGIIDLRHPADALLALVDLQQGRVLQVTPFLTVISSR